MMERQGSNREINATSVHYYYYVSERQTKTIRLKNYKLQI